MQSPLPRTLGRYELREELGRGETTVAYRGHDPGHDRAVVVKALALPPDASANERTAFEARFLEEARRASLVSHPSLVATHDCGKDEGTGTLFVVQEYVAGMSLAQALVPGEPRPWDEALRVVSGVGRALQQLHAAGLVHRHVRPNSILLLDGGAPKLADSGLATFESSRLTLTSRQPAFGELLYTSPEQAAGERVDARTDIFALGAVAYRLLTGRDAFESDNPERILARVVHDRPQPPSALVAGLPPGVDDALAKALAKSRKDRYADANAFCDDIDDLLAGRPPRHVQRDVAKPDTGQFLAAEATGREGGEAIGTGPARRMRRSASRAAAGLVALALVAGLELLRRELEAPDAAPVGRPAVELERREDSRPSPDRLELPSVDEVKDARLSFDFKHTLEKGTLVVTVDGAKVLERRVTGAVKKSLLGIQLREGRVREVIEVSPGRHEIAVKVSWGDDQRTGKLAGTFNSGATRRLAAKVGRIGKRLSVEWE